MTRSEDVKCALLPDISHNISFTFYSIPTTNRRARRTLTPQFIWHTIPVRNWTNCRGEDLLEAIINEALDWERRSGATFEAEKTAIIHFTRKLYKSDSELFTIKGQNVQPKDHVKILGVVMDAKLKYKEHIARAASKGLEATMELRRLRGLSPSTARQLFTSTVAMTI